MMASLQPTPQTGHEAPSEAQARSEQALVLKQFAGAVAHELNNVLTATIGNLSLLQDTGFGGGDTPAALVAETMAAVRRAVEMSERLEAFAERARLEPVPFDMNRLAMAVATELRNARSPADVRLALAPVAPMAFVDGNKLTAALAGLAVDIARAFQHGIEIFRIETGRINSPPEGWRPRQPGPHVYARLHCTGGGLHPDFVRNAIRAPYAGGPTSRRGGWDLASVDGFIRQSCGHLAIGTRTEREIGMTFYLPEEP